MKEQSMLDPLFSGSHILNSNITEDEVTAIIKGLKIRQAMGEDEIPNEILKCDAVLPVLYQLFQFIFDTGLVPKEWYKSLVKPIPKSKDSDPRVPLNYRGISLVSCVSKIFTAILANRISNFSEINDLLEEEQGGFRSKRSCHDQSFIL